MTRATPVSCTAAKTTSPAAVAEDTQRQQLQPAHGGGERVTSRRVPRRSNHWIVGIPLQINWT